MKAYLALIKIDLKLALRQRSVIFFNYLFPLIFFFVFAQAFRADQGGAITQVVTMVSVIGILGNGLFGAGMRAVQERETNILRRYKVTPISPAPLLVASMVTGLLTYLPYIMLMLLLAHFRYGMAFPSNIISFLLFASFGLVAFRSIGLTVASVVNSVQESAILTQVLYLSMLFLSGASFPLALFPKWLMTVTQFIPATYLVSGLQSIMLRHESIFGNGAAVGALCLTALLATFVSVKLFRWEKEEKIRTSAKLWLLAVLAPFIVMGAWQAHSQENVVKTRILERELSRSRSMLIRNVRIFSGDSKVIENGAVLIRNSRIDEIFEGDAPDPKALKADVIEGAGKTVLPGLIDVRVHLGTSGGDQKPTEKMIQRELAAYLYSGITAVMSVGDVTDTILKVRAMANSGEKLSAELFPAAAPKTQPASLSGIEACQHFARGDLSLLNRPLVQQTAPPQLLASTRKLINSPENLKLREHSAQCSTSSLMHAWKSGEMLVTGTDAGTPLLLHGPTVQRELELWVQAGIPNDVALQAATWNSARYLHAENRFGAIRKGLEATLVIVDGNPLTDIRAMSSITSVILKGERVARSALFEDD